MRKSGLQKKIAFIFNDVPMPQADLNRQRLPIQKQSETPVNPACPQDAAEPRQTMPSIAAAQAQTVHTPAVPALRPKPLPRMPVTRPKRKSGQHMAALVRKAFAGSSTGHMDSRQKKMTIAVGALTLVFAAVLTVSLGGLGQKKEKSTKTPAATAATDPVKAPQRQWQLPEPLPEQVRDPMNPLEKKPEQTADVTPAGQMMVRGIVFSSTNPSAIINGQIVRQGQRLDGIEIVRINRDSVEFKKDDKHWVQPVQP
jgi:hypothetical protein